MKFLKYLGFPKLLGFVAPTPSTVPVNPQSDISKVLETAADLLQKKGWTTGVTVDTITGSMCTFGAIRSAVFALYPDAKLDDNIATINLAMRKFSTAEDPLTDIIMWNDRKSSFGLARHVNGFVVKRALRKAARA